MRHVLRNTLVTVGVTVALGVGPGVGMANAANAVVPVPDATSGTSGALPGAMDLVSGTVDQLTPIVLTVGE